jgi:hypothetical protein
LGEDMKVLTYGTTSVTMRLTIVGLQPNMVRAAYMVRAADMVALPSQHIVCSTLARFD